MSNKWVQLDNLERMIAAECPELKARAIQLAVSAVNDAIMQINASIEADRLAVLAAQQQHEAGIQIAAEFQQAAVAMLRRANGETGEIVTGLF